MRWWDQWLPRLAHLATLVIAAGLLVLLLLLTVERIADWIVWRTQVTQILSQPRPGGGVTRIVPGGPTGP